MLLGKTSFIMLLVVMPARINSLLINSLLGNRSPLRFFPLRRAFSINSAPIIEAKESTLDLYSYNLPTNENSNSLLKIRHSAAHVMAMAVQRIRPDAKVAIGPWIDNGFYYDFFFPTKQLTDAELPLIKKEMEKIIKSNLPITKEVVTRDEAKRRILEQGETYKLEILDNIKLEPITLYHIGNEWWDLCAGPHVNSTGQIIANAVKLESLAGAYWRGDEKRPMLQRIYATAWESKEQLNIYEARIEESKKRDHRAIGRALDLFSIQDEAGGGLVFWHAKGSILRRQIEDFWKNEHLKSGYELLFTPHIANINLWKISGHVDFYKKDMFSTIDVDDEKYQIKPMNCPFHCLIYKDKIRSYRDLPIRWAELGTVYRYERSGTLHGLFRVRGFTQDDAHIFCLPSQLEDEIIGVLDLTEKILMRFGFDKYDIMLSTRPKDSVGTDDIWDKATNALIGALNKKKWEYCVDEGGGAFYGPKIDLKIRDAIGRKWQCSTIQCDFNLPDRFNLTYSSADQTKSRPIMIHRAIFGSIERFIGVLTESTTGDYPLWVSPIQLRLLPVVDEVRDYCLEIKRAAETLGIRVEIDSSGQRLSKQIRTSEVERIPVVGIVGANEKNSKGISVRVRKGGEVGIVSYKKVLEYLSEVVNKNVSISVEDLKALG